MRQNISRLLRVSKPIGLALGSVKILNFPDSANTIFSQSRLSENHSFWEKPLHPPSGATFSALKHNTIWMVERLSRNVWFSLNLDQGNIVFAKSGYFEKISRTTQMELRFKENSRKYKLLRCPESTFPGDVLKNQAPPEYL